ncbi:MAG: hypothetical protein AAGD43_28905, partial [Pseudomonadota bacterium]
MRPILIAMLVVCTSIAASAAAGLWFSDIKFDAPWNGPAASSKKEPTAHSKRAPERIVRANPDQQTQRRSSIARPAVETPKAETPKAETPKVESPKSKSQFDVILVSPDDVSVFAGLSEPNKEIAILADGKMIGTTKTDGVGNWVFTTESKIKNPDAKFTVEVFKPRIAAASQEKPVKKKARADKSLKTVAQLRTSMIAKLKEMVEEADRAVAEPKVALQTKPSVARAEPVSPTSQAVPIPILFVYRQAEFTDEGRQAANLLVNYLKSKKLERVTLSGHADERGSHKLN